eukprot:gene13357-biopygen20024
MKVSFRTSAVHALSRTVPPRVQNVVDSEAIQGRCQSVYSGLLEKRVLLVSRGCGPSANNAADVVLWWRPPPGVETARPQQCMRYGWVFFRPPATRWTGQAQGGCSPLEDTRCSLCGRLCRRGVVAAPPPPPCRVELLPALGITGFRVRESRGPETRAGPGPAPGGARPYGCMLKGVRLFAVAVSDRPPTTRWAGQAALEDTWCC